MRKQIDSYEKGTWQLKSTTGYCSPSVVPSNPPSIYFSQFSIHEKKISSHLNNPRRRSAAAATEHEMVGLSVILESHKDLCENRGNQTQIVSKGGAIKPSSPTSPQSPSVFSRSENLANFSPVSGFLEICFLCKHKLSPGKDIFMYKGDKAFCSVECRYRQIFMDEEESNGKSGCTLEYNCSMAATSSPAPASSSSGSGKKGGRIRNAFAY